MNQSFETWIPIAGVGLIVVPIGLILGYFFYINNCASTREIRAVLFEAKPYDIRSVTIDAEATSKTRTSLVAESVTSHDAKSITEVNDALATAVEGNPPKGVKDWVAMLRVTHAKREATVEVISYKDYGVWLYLRTDGTSGWNLGTYQCNALGPVLERLTGYTRKLAESDPQTHAPEIPASAESGQ